MVAISNKREYVNEYEPSPRQLLLQHVYARYMDPVSSTEATWGWKSQGPMFAAVERFAFKAKREPEFLCKVSIACGSEVGMCAYVPEGALCAACCVHLLIRMPGRDAAETGA